MRRLPKILLALAGLYAAGWAAYVAKSAMGINLLARGGHHGSLFPGSDRTLNWFVRHG